MLLDSMLDDNRSRKTGGMTQQKIPGALWSNISWWMLPEKICWIINAPGIFVGSYISSPENLWLPENMLGQNDPGMSVDSRTLPKIVLGHKTIPEIPPCVGPSTAHVCCSWYPPAHDAGPQLPLRLACKVWHRHCTQSIHIGWCTPSARHIAHDLPTGYHQQSVARARWPEDVLAFNACIVWSWNRERGGAYRKAGNSG